MQINEQQIEKFLSDDNFLDWVKYPTKENGLFWSTYFKENPSQLIWAEEARSIIEATLDTDNEDVEAYNTIKTQLFAQIEADEKQVPIYPFWQQHWVKIAASIALIVGLSCYYFMILNDDGVYQNNVSAINKNVEMMEVANTSSKSKLIILPDGSTVILQPKSKIGYSKTFDGTTREVALSGEAFFEIEKNPSKPFYVHANELITKVLGTSFIVKAFSNDKHISIEVKTGKVAVCQKNDPKIKDFINQIALVGIVLSPHEKVDFDRVETKLIKIFDDSSEYLSRKRKTNQFDFEDAPIKNVFEIIEREYNVDIIVDEELVKNCSFTASLENQHLFNKMDIICKTIDARYEMIDGKIIVYAQKCN